MRMTEFTGVACGNSEEFYWEVDEVTHRRFRGEILHGLSVALRGRGIITGPWKIYPGDLISYLGTNGGSHPMTFIFGYDSPNQGV